MQSTHRILDGDARDLGDLADGSVHLVVTSPPYPMIGMWDAAFAGLAPAAGEALARGDGAAAFEAMHQELDRAWRACHRVLVEGGLCCINIGDATRTLGGRFALWPNHARILAGAAAAGFTVLPDLLWHKPTNAPTKFMGSGMLPAGAYVTYEHEYVLVLRKGGARAFPRAEDRARRQRSAFFWEERNTWFSDLWQGLTGTRQEGEVTDLALRQRSAAFPLELPWRLVQMYSLYGDLVLDPFAGSGTTALAAAMSGRDSTSVEPDPGLRGHARERLGHAPDLGAGRARARLEAHLAFVAARVARGSPPGHHNAPHGVPVVTGQETALELWIPTRVHPTREGARIDHLCLGPRAEGAA